MHILLLAPPMAYRNNLFSNPFTQFPAFSIRYLHSRILVLVVSPLYMLHHFCIISITFLKKISR